MYILSQMRNPLSDAFKFISSSPKKTKTEANFGKNFLIKSVIQ